MDAGFEERAARRRATLVGGTAHSHEELDEADFQFWQSRTPAERLAATWQGSGSMPELEKEPVA